MGGYQKYLYYFQIYLLALKDRLLPVHSVGRNYGSFRGNNLANQSDFFLFFIVNKFIIFLQLPLNCVEEVGCKLDTTSALSLESSNRFLILTSSNHHHHIISSSYHGCQASQDGHHIMLSKLENLSALSIIIISNFYCILFKQACKS